MLVTHGHLTELRPQPYCDDCLVPLTMKPIMVKCPSYQGERRRLLGITYNTQTADTTMKKILGDHRDFNIEVVMEILE